MSDLDRLRDDSEPPVLSYVWRWWGDLADCRESGFGVFGPLMHREILAWATIHKIEISAAECDALRQIDRAFRTYLADKDKPAEKRPSDALAEAAFIAQAERNARKGKTKGG